MEQKIEVKVEFSPEHSDHDPLESPYTLEFEVEGCRDSVYKYYGSPLERPSPPGSPTYGASTKNRALPSAKRKWKSVKEESAPPPRGKEGTQRKRIKTDDTDLSQAGSCEAQDAAGHLASQHNSLLKMDTEATEAFILAMRNRPALWMSSRPHSKYKNVIKTLWEEVKLLFPDCPDVKKRWKGLKDTYRKELKKIPATRVGDEITDVDIKWRHFKSLSFIKDEILHTDDECDAVELENNLIQKSDTRQTDAAVSDDGNWHPKIKEHLTHSEHELEHDNTEVPIEQGDLSIRNNSKMNTEATEAFIAAMRDRPALWKLSAYPLHKYKKTIKTLWEEIKQLFPECPDVKKKWKGLKDTYRKELKRVPIARTSSGAITDVEIRWKYFNLLTFIKDEVVSTNYDSLVVSCNTSNSERKSVILTSQDTLQADSSRIQTIQTENQPSSLTLTATNNMASENRVTNLRADFLEIEKRRLRMMELEVLLRNRNIDVNEEEKSEDYHFLMSILPRVEQLPTLQRMRVRQKINQVVLEEMEMLADDQRMPEN